MKLKQTKDNKYVNHIINLEPIKNNIEALTDFTDIDLGMVSEILEQIEEESPEYYETLSEREILMFVEAQARARLAWLNKPESKVITDK